MLVLIGAVAVDASESSCYKDIEKNFFNENLVNQALALHNISQSNWSLINQSLRENSKDISRVVRQRAAKMNPNPFDSPFRPLIAAKLLNQVQFEIFSSTLAAFGVANSEQVKEMFLFIRTSHGQKLIACFGAEVMEF